MAKVLVNTVTRSWHDVVEDGAEFPVAEPLAWRDAPVGLGAGWTFDGAAFAPPAGPNLAEAKAAAVARIHAERDARMGAGVAYNGATFESDADSRATLSEVLVTLRAAGDHGLTPPATLTWRDADNGDHELTHAQLAALALTMLGYCEAVFAAAAQAKDAIRMAATPAAVAAAEAAVNWPA